MPFACGLPLFDQRYWYTGAGDRLGLKDPETGEGLPVAVLPYCGRPLLESLIRDVQAREYLYFKLHGVQQMTPIAIMTSDAKDNHRRVTDFIASCDWFGRGKESFRSHCLPTESSTCGFYCWLAGLLLLCLYKLPVTCCANTNIWDCLDII